MIARTLTGTSGEQASDQLLLLLRSSGDETAERIRLDTLRSSSERLAAAGNRRPDDDRGLLDAQVVLAAALGSALLRVSTAFEPLASAGEADVLVPLRALTDALLPWVI